MLSEEDIRAALHASRVVPIPVANPHGPLGLEQLAEAVREVVAGSGSPRNFVQRPVALPPEVWDKLDQLARDLGKKKSQQVTGGEVAAALVLKGLNAAKST